MCLHYTHYTQTTHSTYITDTTYIKTPNTLDCTLHTSHPLHTHTLLPHRYQHTQIHTYGRLYVCTYVHTYMCTHLRTHIVTSRRASDALKRDHVRLVKRHAGQASTGHAFSVGSALHQNRLRIFDALRTHLLGLAREHTTHTHTQATDPMRYLCMHPSTHTCVRTHCLHVLSNHQTIRRRQHRKTFPPTLV